MTKIRRPTRYVLSSAFALSALSLSGVLMSAVGNAVALASDSPPPAAAPVSPGELYHGLFSWCTFREKTQGTEAMAKLVRDVRVMGPEFGFSAVRTVEMANPSDLKILFLLTAPWEVALMKEGLEIKAVLAPEYAPSPEDPISAPGEKLYPYLFTNTGEEGGRIFEYGENTFTMRARNPDGERISLPFALTVLQPEAEDVAKGPEAGSGMTIQEGRALSPRSAEFARMTIPGAKRAAKKAAQTGRSADCFVVYPLPACVQDSGKYCDVRTDNKGNRILSRAVYNVCDNRWEPEKGRAKRGIGTRYVASKEVVSEFSKQEFSLSGIMNFLKNPASLPSTIITGVIIEATQMPEWVITALPAKASPAADKTP